MRNIISVSLLALSILSLSSCTTYTRTAAVANQTYSDVTIDPVGGKLDLDNVREVSGTSSSWYFLFFRVSGDNKQIEVPVTGEKLSKMFLGRRIRKVQNSALYKATDGQDIDMILCPRYKNTKRSYLFGLITNYKSEVNAYGTKVKNFYSYDVDGVVYSNRKNNPKMSLEHADYTTKEARKANSRVGSSVGMNNYGDVNVGYENSENFGSGKLNSKSSSKKVRAPYLEKYRDFSKKTDNND